MSVSNTPIASEVYSVVPDPLAKKVASSLLTPKTPVNYFCGVGLKFIYLSKTFPHVLISSLLAAALCGCSCIIQCASHPYAPLSSHIF